MGHRGPGGAWSGSTANRCRGSTPPIWAFVARTVRRAGSLELAGEIAQHAVARGAGDEAVRARGEIAKARGDKAQALVDFASWSRPSTIQPSASSSPSSTSITPKSLWPRSSSSRMGTGESAKRRAAGRAPAQEARPHAPAVGSVPIARPLVLDRGRHVRPLRSRRHRAQMAGLWDDAPDLPRRAPPGRAQAVRARHVPVPVGRGPPRRPSRGLHGDRHRRALQAHARLRRAAPDGLGRVRPAGRAVRDQDRHAPDAITTRRTSPTSSASSRCSASATTGRARSTPPIPSYVRWTQWIFLQLFERGLAYQAEIPVNWCPELGTVLANEEVIDGKSERGGHPVVRAAAAPVDAADHGVRRSAGATISTGSTGPRPSRSRSTGSAAARAPRSTSAIDGHRPSTLTVFTTRPDTLLRRHLHGARARASARSRRHRPAQQRDRRGLSVRRSVAKQERPRSHRAREDQDRRLHRRVRASTRSPATSVPIWIADYVLAAYGTGAIMAVPAHDERDFEFAEQYGCRSSRSSVADGRGQRPAAARPSSTTASRSRSRPVQRPVLRAKPKRAITDRLIELGKGARRVNYKLRDWVFSRQRYWGEPIPIYFPVEMADAGGDPASRTTRTPIRYDQPIAVAESELPAAAARARRLQAGRRSRGARSRAPSIGASSRRTAAGTRARPTRCRSGPARAGTTCASSIRKNSDRLFDRSERTTRGCRSISTSAAPSTPCCTSSTRASGTRCSSTRAS